jgi:hypothetical protein
MQQCKLVGRDGLGYSCLGRSVALSEDGNTAVIGGFNDDDGEGAAWVFTAEENLWRQEGEKLVGTGGLSGSRQGSSVSLSADGNMVIVGGYNDRSGTGAVWVFCRRDGLWEQQGEKLVGTGAVGHARQGYAVALSADGNTLITGGNFDNGGAGAAWVFVRRGGTWSQEGEKLVGADITGPAGVGRAVAISADGNTAVAGGPNDDSGKGAVWIFTRRAGVWRQSGKKLVGSAAIGAANQGRSVSISSSGTLVVVGGCGDDGERGAAWVFCRRDGQWCEEGKKLVGSGAAGAASQGRSVSVSADEGTILLGGYSDSSAVGATWVFVHTAVAAGAPEGPGPDHPGLLRSYPNPFNSSTTVVYTLGRASEVRLGLHDLLGNEVVVLVHEREEAGRHAQKVEAAGLASGTYFCRLRAGSLVQTGRLVLVK